MIRSVNSLPFYLYKNQLLIEWKVSLRNPWPGEAWAEWGPGPSLQSAVPGQSSGRMGLCRRLCWGGSPSQLAARTPLLGFQINCLANRCTFCSLRSLWGEQTDPMIQAGVASDFTLCVGHQPVSPYLLCGLLVSSLWQLLSWPRLSQQCDFL